MCASQAEKGAEGESEVGNPYLLQLPRLNSRHAHRKDFIVGLERPTIHFWPRKRVKKWGRSSPTRRRSAGVPNFLCHRHMQDGQGEREGDGYGDLCLSCTLHLSALQKAGKSFDIAESSTIKEASSTGKVRKNLSL